MSNSIMMRLIKCLSIIMLVIGCVQPTSVQAYSPVLTETVQNTNNTNKNASVTVQRKEQPKQNTLELFVITVLVTILILFFVGIVHKDLKNIKKRDVEHLLVSREYNPCFFLASVSTSITSNVSCKSAAIFSLSFVSMIFFNSTNS